MPFWDGSTHARSSRTVDPRRLTSAMMSRASELSENCTDPLRVVSVGLRLRTRVVVEAQAAVGQWRNW